MTATREDCGCVRVSWGEGSDAETSGSEPSRGERALAALDSVRPRGPRDLFLSTDEAYELGILLAQALSPDCQRQEASARAC